MKRNMRTKLDYEPFSISRNNRRMDEDITSITNREKKYKKKWKKQHRHSACIKHKFKIRDKVLLKKRKINKWSTAHEKDYYEIFEIHSSIIGARRKSDDRTIHRDASNFKLLLRESGDESCGENHRVSEIDRTHPAQKRKR